ncbi:MAG: hypothetical protein PHR24_04340 [Oscillospiraceae bacterium]|nr:hypothetical protein [Oscillospiraceae bacterium]
MFSIDKLRMKFNKNNKTTLLENPKPYQQRLSLLTALEYKIFMLLREGFSKKECSQRLDMKRGEIKRCVKIIHKKLNLKSSAELIVRYREES